MEIRLLFTFSRIVFMLSSSSVDFYLMSESYRICNNFLLNMYLLYTIFWYVWFFRFKRISDIIWYSPIGYSVEIFGSLLMNKLAFRDTPVLLPNDIFVDIGLIKYRGRIWSWYFSVFLKFTRPRRYFLRW